MTCADESLPERSDPDGEVEGAVPAQELRSAPRHPGGFGAERGGELLLEPEAGMLLARVTPGLWCNVMAVRRMSVAAVDNPTRSATSLAARALVRVKSTSSTVVGNPTSCRSAVANSSSRSTSSFSRSPRAAPNA
jgi:hypothetical protein